jgi:hypothetical protein
VTIRLVLFLDVASFLRQGWVVCLPAVPHPVIDVRAVPMQKLCDCGRLSQIIGSTCAVLPAVY